MIKWIQEEINDTIELCSKVITQPRGSKSAQSFVCFFALLDVEGLLGCITEFQDEGFGVEEVVGWIVLSEEFEGGRAGGRENEDDKLEDEFEGLFQLDPVAGGRLMW